MEVRRALKDAQYRAFDFANVVEAAVDEALTETRNCN